jgi:UDPglucose--hexose-1-phosphate uridylyltransferase
MRRAAPPNPHRRLNLLTGDWVLVSPQRMNRPWQGQMEPVAPRAALRRDPQCYLCAGAVRSGGATNPEYRGPWVFDNDFPALLGADVGASTMAGADSILQADEETGICRVICYCDDHSASLATLSVPEITEIVRVWRDQTAELHARPDIGAVTIFENRGAMMGASSPHPHGQLWATRSVPNELQREVDTQAQWLKRHGQPLLAAYLERELAAGERIVYANEHFVVLVPWWAAWPFETLVLPRRGAATLADLGPDEETSLADALRTVVQRYDRVFNAEFPYTMGLHQAPPRVAAPGFVIHAHFYPPLLRSATVRKFMVGFEMLGMPQRDLTPEAAADRLRNP